MASHYQYYSQLNGSERKDTSCCRKLCKLMESTECWFFMFNITIVVTCILSVIIRSIALIMLSIYLDGEMSQELGWMIPEVIIAASAYTILSAVNAAYAARIEGYHKYAYLWGVGCILYAASLLITVIISQSDINLPSKYYLAILTHSGIIGCWYVTMYAGYHSM
jgi:hypothetical protein